MNNEDPIEENEKKVLENKLSKEKIKNIELRDKLKNLNVKVETLESSLEKKEKSLNDLNKQVASLMKDNLQQSEKLRKGRKEVSIPFSQLDELQNLKSLNSKLEIELNERQNDNLKTSRQLQDTEKHLQRIKEENETLNAL